jgi:hypothetical protein
MVCLKMPNAGKSGGLLFALLLFDQRVLGNPDRTDRQVLND